MKLNRDVLIKELKKSHEKMIEIYSALLEKKIKNESYFDKYIVENYSSIGVNDIEDLKYNLCYMLIDKIIFVKICIDKGFIELQQDFEDKARKMEKIWLNSCKHFYDLNLEYSIKEILNFFISENNINVNSNIYKSELKEAVIALVDMIKKDEFSFSDEESNILVYIYEQFLLNSNKKSKGKFYTPEYVIKYILENTVENADVLKNPFLKILDPACGAGNFLIPIYKCLKHKFKENIVELNKMYKNEEYEFEINGIVDYIKGDKYWTDDNIHYHILKNCIYGADIDKFAVHVAYLNLYLQDFYSNFGEANIIDGDSLLKLEEDYDWKNSKAIIFNKVNSNLSYLDNKSFESKAEIKKFLKQCKFWNNKFDYIVGNPPYVVIVKSFTDDNYWNYIRKRYVTAGYKKNTFYLMIERALNKLKDGGIHSFVIPDRYFLTNSYENSRKMLVDKTRIINITQMKDKLFGEAIVGAAIYVVKKEKVNDNLVELRLNYSMNEYDSVFVNQKDIKKSNHYAVNILTTNNKIDVIERIKEGCKPLKNYCEIHVGMMIKDKEEHFKRAKRCETKEKIVLGRDLDKYVVNNVRYCNLESINIFGGTKNLSKHRVFPKILLRKTGGNLIAAIDYEGIISEQSVYFMIPKDENLVYNILGQVQSEVSNYYFKNYLITNPETYPYIQHYDVQKLPINENLLGSLEYSSYIKNIVTLKDKIKHLNYKDIFKEQGAKDILEKFESIRHKEQELYFKVKHYKDLSDHILLESYGFTERDIDMILDDKKNSSAVEKGDELFLMEVIETYIKEGILDEMGKVLAPMSLDEIVKSLKSHYENYDDLIYIEKVVNGKDELDVIKDVLNGMSQSINSYKKKGKIKEIIKINKYTYALYA